jgi:sigma-E factor negative regulatory protein RseA
MLPDAPTPPSTQPAPLAATPQRRPRRALPCGGGVCRLRRWPALWWPGAAVVVMRPDSPATGWDQSIVATQPATNAGLHQVSRVQASASAQPLVLDGQIIRDARLDAYFEAHRGAVGPAAAAVPGGALRSVEILVPQR